MLRKYLISLGKVCLCILPASWAHAADSKNFDISGVLETEGIAGKNYSSQYISEAKVGKLEVEMTREVTPNIDINFLYKFEDESIETGELDQAYATVKNLTPNVHFAIGRLYLYENFFETNMITDALTLEMIELRMEGLSIRYNQGKTHLNLSLFKSQIESEFDHKAEAVIDFSQEFNTGKDGTLSIKGMYTTNILESQHFSGMVNEQVTKHTQAAGLGLNWYNPMLDFNLQCVGAIEAVDHNVLTVANDSATPTACQTEVGKEINILKPVYLSVGYQWTNEAISLEFPKEKVLTAVSWEVMDNLGMAFELAQVTDYSVADGGTGNKAYFITGQVSVEF